MGHGEILPHADECATASHEQSVHLFFARQRRRAGWGRPVTSVGMETYVVRVWVPDRPGALGQVASRIGSVGGDVIGIDILERGAGRAIDELVVTLPSSDLLHLLAEEIAQVDEAAVEEIRRVDGEIGEPGIAALEAALRVVESAAGERNAVLCAEVRSLFGADWVCLCDPLTRAMVFSIGSDAPSAAWLLAYVEGSRHLPPEQQSGATPPDLTWADLVPGGLVLALGRVGSPVRARERRQLALLARLAATLDR
jgi:hypothetical protein